MPSKQIQYRDIGQVVTTIEQVTEALQKLAANDFKLLPQYQIAYDKLFEVKHHINQTLVDTIKQLKRGKAMKTTISVEQGKLCFHHIQQPTDIMYQFEDRIGIFTKFPLTFEINNHMVTLDLKHHFSSGIISGLKIKMALDVEAREPIILDDINPLYIVTIHVDKEALYITLTAKDNLVTIHCQGNQLQLISDYKCTTYLGQLVAGTMLPTAKYFVTKDKHIIMEDMLTMMQHLAIRQQRWSVYVQLKDDCGNQYVEKVQLTDWIHQNKALLAQYSVDYHQKITFIIWKCSNKTSLPISIQAVNQRLYSLTCDRNWLMTLFI